MHNPQPLASGQAEPRTGSPKGNQEERRGAGLTASAAPFKPSASPPRPLTATARPFTPTARPFTPASAQLFNPSMPSFMPTAATQRPGSVNYFPPPFAMPSPLPMTMQTPLYSPVPAPYMTASPFPYTPRTFTPAFTPTYTPKFTASPPITPAEPMCQVIAHYHTCGCRAKPTFICGRRSCTHERPTQISVGKLPFPCTAKWTGNTTPAAEGRGPACQAPDPGTKEWIRDMGMSKSFGKLLVLTGDIVTLDDLVLALPDDAEFDDWAEELKTKCNERKVETVDENADQEKKEEEVKEAKPQQSEKKSTMVDSSMQTDDLPEEKEEEEPPVSTQTEEPPQVEMKSVATEPILMSMATQSTMTEELPKEKPEMSTDEGTQSTMTSVAAQSAMTEEISVNSRGTQWTELDETKVELPHPDELEIAFQTAEIVSDDDADADADADADDDDGDDDDEDDEDDTLSVVSEDYYSAGDFRDPYEDYDDYDSDEEGTVVIDCLLDIDCKMAYTSSDEDEDEGEDEPAEDKKEVISTKSTGFFQRFTRKA